MDQIDRRAWMTMAAAAVASAPGASLGQASFNGEPAPYDYLMLDLAPPPGTTARQAIGDLAAASQAQLSTSGGEVLGVFSPQLGWPSSQAALLLGWAASNPERDGAVRRLTGAAPIGRSAHDRLTPTARPTQLASPPPGGIYVHRWFIIAPPDLEEFVELSELGWRDFEARFDTNIYGLFKADPAPQDLAAGETRLLLITRYGDHGVWEKSRDPSTAAMAAFGRRQRLTRRTWAASTLLLRKPA